MICYCESINILQSVDGSSFVKLDEATNKYSLMVGETSQIEVKFCFVCGWELAESFDDWVVLNNHTSETLFDLQVGNNKENCVCEFSTHYLNNSFVKFHEETNEIKLSHNGISYLIYFCPLCGKKVDVS